MADFVALLVPPDIADLLAKSADQVPQMVVVQSADRLFISDECTVVIIPALADGRQPSFTTELTNRARKVVSFSRVLKDRDVALETHSYINPSVLGSYRNYLDDRLAQLRRELVEAFTYFGKVVAAMEKSVGVEHDYLEDELASAKNKRKFIQAAIRAYSTELDGVLELEKTL